MIEDFEVAVSLWQLEKNVLVHSDRGAQYWEEPLVSGGF